MSLRRPNRTVNEKKAGGLNVQPQNATEPDVLEAGWKGLIDFRNTESTAEGTKPEIINVGETAEEAAMDNVASHRCYLHLRRDRTRRVYRYCHRQRRHQDHPGYDRPITSVSPQDYVDKGHTKLTLKKNNTSADENKSRIGRSVKEAEHGGIQEATEPNPWPGALSPGGQKFQGRDRFLAMSRDCRRVAVEYPDQNILRIFGSIKPFGGGKNETHGSYVWDGDFSPDGKYLASNDRDHNKIWNAQTGVEVCRLSETGIRVFLQS